VFLRRFPTLLTGIAAFAVAWFVAISGLGQRLEFALSDAGMRALQHEVASDVVIIAIDAKSLAEPHEWPWPRRFHAELIERLAPATPRKLFLDIDFSASSSVNDDQRLEAALASWDGAEIVLPAFYQFASPTDGDVILTQPMPALRQHATTASVNLRPSSDGLVRTVHSTWSANDRTIASAAVLLNGHSGSISDEFLIDYSIDPASFDFISYSDVLANRIPAVHFADKVIFVGATAIELGDIVAVPIHQSLPGVAVQALAFETLRQGLHDPVGEALHPAPLHVHAGASGSRSGYRPVRPRRSSETSTLHGSMVAPHRASR
jgi:CHASE2 domain-containing sensor protein